MYLVALVTQEYPTEVYQPKTVPIDTKILLVHDNLDLTDSSFDSSDILTLVIMISSQGNYMNITLIDNQPNL